MGDEAMASSPKSKLKFLCSHGGKILPRPIDGQLKYVGGETRVLTVPRSITSSELNEKFHNLVDCEMVLKYQIMAEDLDTLISVKNDDDVKHMIEEYDRQGAADIPWPHPNFRTYLFPPAPFSGGHHHRHYIGCGNSPTVAGIYDCTPTCNAMPTMEQLYIDAINGIACTSSTFAIHPTTNVSSAGSSPRSDAPLHRHHQNGELLNDEGMLYSARGSSSPSRVMQKSSGLHRVQSSPSFSSSTLEDQPQQRRQLLQPSHHLHHYPRQQIRIPPRTCASPRFPRSGGEMTCSRHYHQHPAAGQQQARIGGGGCYMRADGGRANYRNGG